MSILVFGSKGMLGGELVRQLGNREVVGLDNNDLDITDKTAVQLKIQELKPDVIFNCVAYNGVDQAEKSPDKELAFALNADAVGFIAEEAEKTGSIFIHYSSGFVFDGENQNGYTEQDTPSPISVYGESKLEGEKQALKSSKCYLIRLNLLFGKAGSSPKAKKSFPDLILGLAKDKNEFDFVTDEVSTPTYAADLASASIQLVDQKYPYGIYHLVNEGSASWLDFAKEVFKVKGINATLNPTTSDKFVRPALRPKNSVLLNTKFPKLRSWQEALESYLA
jgi:dTDP-4-dehydrorhamnose reductase